VLICTESGSSFHCLVLLQKSVIRLLCRAKDPITQIYYFTMYTFLKHHI